MDTEGIEPPVNVSDSSVKQEARAGISMYRGLSKSCGGLRSGDRGERGGPWAVGRDRARANFFFGTGGGVPSEKNLNWCWAGSELHSGKD